MKRVRDGVGMWSIALARRAGCNDRYRQTKDEAACGVAGRVGLYSDRFRMVFGDEK